MKTPDPDGEFTPAAADLTPGTVVRVPGRYHPAHPGRPYCLEIMTSSVSRETGAVDLFGTVLPADGTAGTRKKPLHRRVVEQPARLTVVRRGCRAYRTNTGNGGTRYWRSPAGAWFLDMEDGRPLTPMDAPGGIFSPAGLDAGVAKGELVPEEGQPAPAAPADMCPSCGGSLAAGPEPWCRASGGHGLPETGGTRP